MRKHDDRHSHRHREKEKEKERRMNEHHHDHDRHYHNDHRDSNGVVHQHESAADRLNSSDTAVSQEQQPADGWIDLPPVKRQNVE